MSLFLLRTLSLSLVFLVINIEVSLGADPQVMKQLSSLQRQVRVLQQELASLKSTMKVSKGNLSITVPQVTEESVGGDKKIQVGRDLHSRVGRSQTLLVGDNLFITVNGDQSETIGKNMNLNVKRNIVQAAGQNYSLSANKKLLLMAKDEITFKTGKSSIVMKSNGNITISGKDVNIDASGRVKIKGSQDVSIKGRKVRKN